MPLPYCAAQKSRRWMEYFQGNARRTSLPWDDPYHLTSAERRAVARSMQQFQLGEGANGCGLLRRAEAHARRAQDPYFLDALRLFIAEEQRHSSYLARFLARQGVPLLRSHWVDSVFRRFRKFAGLEVCAGVLVTAELIAVPYYRALHNATQSPLLRALCRQILRDEAQHLRFQASILARQRIRRSRLLRRFCNHLHRLFFLGTLVVVWFEHRPVFCCGGYLFRRFLTECRLQFECWDEEVEKEWSELNGVPLPATPGVTPRRAEKESHRPQPVPFPRAPVV